MEPQENPNAESSSWLAMLVGAFMALLGFALFALLLRASFQAVLPAGSLSGLLLGGLSWAAFLLPAFLWFASLILFLPGFRRDLLFLLVGGLLPFAALAALARFLDGPERWFVAWPSFKALGAQGTAVFWLVLALGSSLGLLALRSLLFGRSAAAPTGLPKRRGARSRRGRRGVGRASLEGSLGRR
jgi:hypothetical protein